MDQTVQLPSQFDLIDFHFGRTSPTKSLFIFLNEVNRADEFGGSVNPEKYADFLNEPKIFSRKSPDFLILSAGLDNGQ